MIKVTFSSDDENDPWGESLRHVLRWRDIHAANEKACEKIRMHLKHMDCSDQERIILDTVREVLNQWRYDD
jgi:hypothetical protein